MIFREKYVQPISLQHAKEIKKLSAKEKKEHMRAYKVSGYSSNDVVQWLMHLKKEGIIAAYKWCRWESWELWESYYEKQTAKVLLMGFSVPSDKKKKRWINKHTHKVYDADTMIKWCEEADAFMNKATNTSAPHAVVLARDMDRDIYLYDDGLKNRKMVTTNVAAVADQISRIISNYGAHIFDIYLHEKDIPIEVTTKMKKFQQRQVQKRERDVDIPHATLKKQKV